MRARTYHFVDHWVLPASSRAVFEVIIDSKHWVDWWDGLESVVVLKDTGGVGSHYECRWNSGVGYRLQTQIYVTDYLEDHHVYFTCSGDLNGTGTFVVSSANEPQTNVEIHWDVETAKPWMNIFSSVLRPFFVYFHHRLMKRGETGLQRYLNRATSNN